MPSYVHFGRSFRRHYFHPLLPLHSRIWLTTELCTSSLRGQRWRSTRPPHPPALPLTLPPFPNIPLGLTSGHMPAFHDVVKLEIFTVALAVATPVCIPAIWLQPPNDAPPHHAPCRVPLPPLPPLCDDSDQCMHLICAQRHAFIPMPRLPAARAPPSPSRRRHHAPAPTRFDRTSQ